MNTYLDLELNNGQIIKMTLNLKRLLMLKSNHVDLYRDINKIITRGADDVFDMVKVLYAGYLCALETGSMEMTYDQFMEAIPQGIGVISNKAAELITAKKN